MKRVYDRNKYAIWERVGYHYLISVKNSYYLFKTLFLAKKFYKLVGGSNEVSSIWTVMIDGRLGYAL